MLIRTAVQAVSLAMADKVELNSAVDGPQRCGLSSISGCCLLSGSLLGEAPIPAPTPEFHGCLLSPFVVLF